MTRIAFSAGAFLVGSYALLLTSLFAAALWRGLAWRRRKKAADAVRPAMSEALVLYLAGSNETAALRSFASTHRRDLTEAVVAFQNTVGGETRDRLCNLALDLGLVNDWCEETRSRDPIRRRTAFARLAFACAYEPCHRVAGDLLALGLRDEDREVRLAACRALLQAGEMPNVEKVFEFAVSHSLLVRILLAEDLRRYAIPLCRRAIPKALKSPDPRRTLATLEMVAAWERAMPLGDLDELLLHRDREIRVCALRLASITPTTGPNRAAILRLLAEEEDTEVRTGAALAAARLKIEEALPLLARCVRLGPAELARTAADALAGMVPKGREVLQDLSRGAEPATAAAASEALARAQAQGDIF
jgi:hypothetical protein